MRLGGYDMDVKPGTLAYRLYGRNKVRERFRHRWNCNPGNIDTLESAGLIFSGYAPQKRVMQVLELPQDMHPFFLATQFHAEFTSKPLAPNPLFKGFIEAAIKRRGSKGFFMCMK